MEPETLTVAQILEEVANRDLLDLRLPVTRDGKDLVLTPEILAMFFPDSNGRLRPLLNTSGEVTEGNSQLIVNGQGYQLSANFQANGVYFNGTPTGAGARAAAQKLIAVVPLVTNAGGDSGVVDLVPTLAGFEPCMRLLYVYADASDPAWDLAMTVDAGALVGMPNFTGLATVVNVIGPDWTPGGLLYHGDTDAAIIQGHITNGGNVVTYYFVIEYWYET